MTLTPDGRVTIPVDLDECKIELLGFQHSTTQERWVLALCEEIEQLRAAQGIIAGFGKLWEARYHIVEERVRELERKQFVGNA